MLSINNNSKFIDSYEKKIWIHRYYGILKKINNESIWLANFIYHYDNNNYFYRFSYYEDIYQEYKYDIYDFYKFSYYKDIVEELEYDIYDMHNKKISLEYFISIVKYLIATFKKKKGLFIRYVNDNKSILRDKYNEIVRLLDTSDENDPNIQIYEDFINWSRENKLSRRNLKKLSIY